MIRTPPISPARYATSRRAPCWPRARCRRTRSASHRGSIIRHTGSFFMVQKIAVTLEKETVAEVDRWVREGKYPNRSRALQSAVTLLAEREKRRRLTRELGKMDRREEQRMAEEGVGASTWPPY